MILSCALLIPPNGAHAVASDRWHTVLDPAPGAPRVFGSYTAGCIQGAVALPPDGEGFITLRLGRRFFYGHPTLVRYVQALGRRAAEQGLGIVQVGDLGQPRGGPAPDGHRSHQTGLDVDIWFQLSPPDEIPDAEARETLQPPSLLTPDGRGLDSRRWTPRQVHLLRLAADLPLVERIFVNPVIKRALCESRPGERWLGKIRPWWGHDAHFHVRLRCPDGETSCAPQPPPPGGNGCDASLEWWFFDEARVPPTSEKPMEPPPLPVICSAILGK